MSAKRRGAASVLGGLRQSGSLKALFPRPAGKSLQAVLVNTAGGVTGGDRFRLHVTAGAETHLTLTTQAAERAYRAANGETGRIRNALRVEAGARLNWLPQETILFDGCALRRTLSVELEEGAQLLLVEPLVFGRAAMGERLSHAIFHDRIEIRRGATPLFLDAISLVGDVAAHLARPVIADSAGAMATLLYVAQDAETFLSDLRLMLPTAAGASLISNDMLVIRAVDTDSHALRRYLIPILNRLTGDALPRPWMI